MAHHKKLKPYNYVRIHGHLSHHRVRRAIRRALEKMGRTEEAETILDRLAKTSDERLIAGLALALSEDRW